MSDHDVFQNNSPTPPASPDDLLASIKNEAGEPKYKTVQDALNALNHSQAFIETLKAEKAKVEQEAQSLRELQSKQASIEQVLAKLNANDEALKAKEATPPVGGLSAEQVAELVRKELDTASAKQTYESNLAKVQNSLKLKFGDKTSELVAKKASELGTTPQQLGELSKTNPQLVLALFETGGKLTPTPVTGSVNLPSNPQVPELEKPAKSLLLGATTRDQMEYMKQVKDNVYRRHNVTT